MNILFRGETEQLLFENSHGLVFSDARGRKNMLAGDCIGNFDLAFSEKLNVVYINSSGELIRLERKGEGWSKTVILKSRSGEMNIFGIKLIVSEGILNLIYGLCHNSELLLVHQELPDGRPQVVNSAYGEQFFVRRDETGCIYIICEAAENIWQVSVLRKGGWSSPEELMSECRIIDIMTCGYKSFCSIYEKDGNTVFESSDEHFEVKGKNPSIVIADGKFKIVSEHEGRIYCTDSEGQNKIISSADIRDFYLRLPESGEFAVCERCRGCIVQEKPRLFLIDNAKPQKSIFGETARLELTKQIIALEARIARLEDMNFNNTRNDS